MNAPLQPATHRRNPTVHMYWNTATVVWITRRIVTENRGKSTACKMAGAYALRGYEFPLRVMSGITAASGCASAPARQACRIGRGAARRDVLDITVGEITCHASLADVVGEVTYLRGRRADAT